MKVKQSETHPAQPGKAVTRIANELAAMRRERELARSIQDEVIDHVVSRVMSSIASGEEPAPTTGDQEQERPSIVVMKPRSAATVS